jgi:hypothetical protein
MAKRNSEGSVAYEVGVPLKGIELFVEQLEDT